LGSLAAVGLAVAIFAVGRVLGLGGRGGGEEGGGCRLGGPSAGGEKGAPPEGSSLAVHFRCLDLCFGFVRARRRDGVRGVAAGEHRVVMMEFGWPRPCVIKKLSTEIECGV
jgi:hypothetical protein